MPASWETQAAGCCSFNEFEIKMKTSRDLVVFFIKTKMSKVHSTHTRDSTKIETSNHHQYNNWKEEKRENIKKRQLEDDRPAGTMWHLDQRRVPKIIRGLLCFSFFLTKPPAWLPSFLSFLLTTYVLLPPAVRTESNYFLLFLISYTFSILEPSHSDNKEWFDRVPDFVSFFFSFPTEAWTTPSLWDKKERSEKEETLSK